MYLIFDMCTHEIPFYLKKKKEEENNHTGDMHNYLWFTFNSHRLLAAPHIWKLLKYTGAVRYILSSSACQCILSKSLKYEERKMYFNALISNF